MISGIIAGFPRKPIASWSPAELNPQLWMDEVSDMTLSGSKVVSWNNRGSLLGQFFVSGLPPTVTTVGGIRTVVFSGSTLEASAELHNLARGTPCAWVYAVYTKRTTDPADTIRPIMVGTTQSGGYLLSIAAGSNSSGGSNKAAVGGRRGTGGSFSGVTAPTSVVGARMQTFGQLDYINRQIDLRVNGSASGVLTNAFDTAGNSTSTPLARLVLGYDLGTYGDADLVCIISGASRLTTLEMQKLEGWAAHRYNIAASLPINHPYKTNPPI